MNYTEVEYRRRTERVNNRTIITHFDRVRVLREGIQIAEDQARTLNAGRLTCAGNIEFGYLIADGEADPGPITQTLTVSGGSTGVDIYGNVIKI